MTEEDAFLAAVLSEPHDDTPRLVFADWLEERDGPGDAARAEFIRLSVSAPETTFWPHDRASEGTATSFEPGRATALCCDHWDSWTELLCQRLTGSPLRRWLGTENCRWGYRRGFVAVFEGTEQVLLDAWNDLFQLGPIEEVYVSNLWHFGTVLSLRHFLDRPSLRVLRLRAEVLRVDDVSQLVKVSDWLTRLDRVELIYDQAEQSAVRDLVTWKYSDWSLQHVRCYLRAAQ
jgi:uncharacterized protein (TIGR02996 family)